MKKNRTKRLLSLLLTLCMVMTLAPMTALAAETYTLTIVNGTKSETVDTVIDVEAGTGFNVTANEAPEGKVFDRWVTVDGVTISNPLNSLTWITMPENNATITATYKNTPATDTELSDIVVSISKGSGWEHPALAPVYDKTTRNYTLNVSTDYTKIYFYPNKMYTEQTVTATVDGVTLAMESSGTTSQHILTKYKTVFVFTVKAQDDTTTGTYTITVNHGSGTLYPVTVNGGTTTTPTPAEGDTVTITANTPATGKVFDKWTTADGVSFANANSATTKFIMPTKAVTVTATYKNDPQMDTELNGIEVSIMKSGSTWEHPALTPVYDKTTRNYTLNVSADYTGIYFYSNRIYDQQTVTATVDGVTLAMTENTTSSYNFTKAVTVFVFTVKAQDGTTTGSYTITVNRGSGTIYPVTVNGGTTTTPTPAQNDIVTITANALGPNYKFIEWIGTGSLSFVEDTSRTTSIAKFVMPATSVELTATYDYNIFSVMPTGGVAYMGEDFSYSWTVSDPEGRIPGGGIDSVKLQENNAGVWVTVSEMAAAYKNLGTHTSTLNSSTAVTKVYRLLYRVGTTDYTSYSFEITHKALQVLTVINGTTDSSLHKAGDVVTVTKNASPPAGKSEFLKWISTDISIPSGSAGNESYTFTMPDNDVTVKAFYESTAAADTTLGDIQISLADSPRYKYAPLTLTPVFDSNTMGYTINSSLEYYKMKITMPRKTGIYNQTVTVKIEGIEQEVSEDATSYLTGDYDFTKAISVVEITVTSEDGSDSDTYRITIKRGSAISRALTVIDGTPAISTFVAGDRVTITANEPAEGKMFVKWTSDDITLSTTNPPGTTYTFTMPDKDVMLIANYANIRSLKVINGTAINSIHWAGQEVTIVADESGGLLLDKWVSSDITLPEPNPTPYSPSYTFTMPDHDVVIKAKYKNNPMLTVINGTPSVIFPTPGHNTMAISADPAPEGQEFSKWVWVDGDIISRVTGSVTSSNPYIVMPNRDMTIKAIYESTSERDSRLSSIGLSVYKDTYPSTSSYSAYVNPTFDKDIKEYTVELLNTYTGIKKITLGLGGGNTTATAKIDGSSYGITKSTDGQSFTTDPYEFVNTNTVFEITVTSEDGLATSTYKITIKRTSYNIAPTIDSANLPDGLVGMYYSYKPKGAGTNPLEWTIGNLPPGLSIYEGTFGTITILGTPETAGTYFLDYSLKNVAGETDDGGKSIIIREPLTGTVVLTGDEEDVDVGYLIANVTSNSTGILTYNWTTRDLAGVTYEHGETTQSFWLDEAYNLRGKILICEVRSSDKVGSISGSTFIPELDATPTPADLANTAITRAMSLIPDTMAVVEETDINLIDVLNMISGMSETGVTFTLDASTHSSIADNGEITYGAAVVDEVLTVKVNKALGTEQTKVISVLVPAEESFLYGDVNGDTFINVSDAAAIIRYFVKGTALLIPAAADVTKDGFINVSDAAAIIRYFVKGTPLPVNLP